jgi:hypothetical protein
MSFAWSKKLRQIAPAPPTVIIQPEVEQVVIIPTVDDKISVEEHKNGECLVSSCKEDNEVGRGKEEVNGEEVVLPCVEDSKDELQEE